MFRNASRDAPLVLVDYGSGTIEETVTTTPLEEIVKQEEQATNEVKPTTQPDPVYIEQDDGTSLLWHTTFAGSAFYISPEMFRKKYTLKTDVWSIGVVLYVLVAGYPADTLQKAFNMLQNSKDADTRKDTLRELPHMPKDIPETFFDMLEMALTYRHRKRSTANDILSCDFVKFHKEVKEENTRTLGPPISCSLPRKPVFTESKVMKGFVDQHNNFERSFICSKFAEEAEFILKSFAQKTCRDMEGSSEREIESSLVDERDAAPTLC